MTETDAWLQLARSAAVRAYRTIGAVTVDDVAALMDVDPPDRRLWSKVFRCPQVWRKRASVWSRGRKLSLWCLR